MKIPDLSNLLKRLVDHIPKRDIEKLVFKTLLGVWALVTVASAVLRVAIGGRDDIEKKMIEAARDVESLQKEKLDMGKYEALLTVAKYPEGLEEYLSEISRDPFSERKAIIAKPSARQDYDFALKSVDHIPLPMVYRGFIELPDRIIGQVNWRDETRFVELGTALNGYKIRDISKKKIDAINEKGQELEFKLNEVIYGNELQAVLYDRLSRETFDVRQSAEIGEYKVIDIGPNYVILNLKGKELKLEI